MAWPLMQKGALYVSTSSSVDVFAANGQLLGEYSWAARIAWRGHLVEKIKNHSMQLFLMALFGPNAANQIIRIPMLAQGYLGRAK